jgi:hypothetical protein
MLSKLLLFITGISIIAAITASILCFVEGEEVIWAAVAAAWAIDSFFLQIQNRLLKSQNERDGNIYKNL